MAIDADSLDGINVLVTRPVGRADSLCSLIEKHGGAAVAVAVIEIIPPRDVAELDSVVANLQAVDLVIFVSVHAVAGVADALSRCGLSMPSQTKIGAVGPKTAAHCKRVGMRVDFVPDDAHINSEGLLHELRDINFVDKNVIIFRGQSGREVLPQALQSRGAKVRCVECYRRQTATDSSLLKRRLNQPIHAVVIGSVAVLDSLMALLDGRHRAIPPTPIFAYSKRIATHCRQANWRGEIFVADAPTDESVVTAIVQWRRANIRDK